MAEKTKLEFFLLRYVPDVVKGEFVNFGLVTLVEEESGVEIVDVRYARSWERVLRLDPQTEVDVLEALRKEISGEIGKARGVADLLRRMEDSFSGAVQMSRAMPVLSEQPAAMEIETVAKTFLEATPLSRTRELSGRQQILHTMREELDRAGVLRLLKPIPAFKYTKKGDPFVFDFGYVAGMQTKLLHAVSLKARVDAGVMLASRYPEIRESMAKMPEPIVPFLTAIVDDDLNLDGEEVKFALSMMRENGIRVEAAARMPEIALEVKADLGV